MRCITTDKYICELCGFEMTYKPICYPECPECTSNDVIYSNKTEYIENFNGNNNVGIGENK